MPLQGADPRSRAVRRTGSAQAFRSCPSTLSSFRRWSSRSSAALALLQGCPCRTSHRSRQRTATTPSLSKATESPKLRPSLRLALYCVQAPLAGDALELVLAAVFEGQSGAGDQILDRARDEHLAGLGIGSDPGPGVHGDA